MKKVLFLLSVALFAFSCAGTEGPRGPQGPKGDPGTPGEDVASVLWEVFPVNAYKENWADYRDQNNNIYYSCTVNVPEIDDFVYESGTILVYYEMITSDALGHVSKAQQILPYTRHYDNGTDRWTRTVDYDFGEGYINFYVTNSDFKIDPPGDMRFRVVIMY